MNTVGSGIERILGISIGSSVGSSIGSSVRGGIGVI